MDESKTIGPETPIDGPSLAKIKPWSIAHKNETIDPEKIKMWTIADEYQAMDHRGRISSSRSGKNESSGSRRRK
jgi:hypothetical protein